MHDGVATTTSSPGSFKELLPPSSRTLAKNAKPPVSPPLSDPLPKPPSTKNGPSLSTAPSRQVPPTKTTSGNPPLPLPDQFESIPYNEQYANNEYDKKCGIFPQQGTPLQHGGLPESIRTGVPHLAKQIFTPEKLQQLHTQMQSCTSVEEFQQFPASIKRSTVGQSKLKDLYKEEMIECKDMRSFLQIPRDIRESREGREKERELNIKAGKKFVKAIKNKYSNCAQLPSEQNILPSKLLETGLPSSPIPKLPNSDLPKAKEHSSPLKGPEQVAPSVTTSKPPLAKASVPLSSQNIASSKAEDKSGQEKGKKNQGSSVQANSSSAEMAPAELLKSNLSKNLVSQENLKEDFSHKESPKPELGKSSNVSTSLPSQPNISSDASIKNIRDTIQKASLPSSTSLSEKIAPKPQDHEIPFINSERPPKPSKNKPSLR